MLYLHKFFPYPTRVPSTVEYGRNQDFLFKDFVIHRKWKAFGQEPMVPENHRMDALEICERVNIGVEGIKEIRAKAGRLQSVEPVSIFEIPLPAASTILTRTKPSPLFCS